MLCTKRRLWWCWGFCKYQHSCRSSSTAAADVVITQSNHARTHARANTQKKRFSPITKFIVSHTQQRELPLLLLPLVDSDWIHPLQYGGRSRLCVYLNGCILCVFLSSSSRTNASRRKRKARWVYCKFIRATSCWATLESWGDVLLPLFPSQNNNVFWYIW